MRDYDDSYKETIECPYCHHEFKFSESKGRQVEHMLEWGDFDVECKCGEKYQVEIYFVTRKVK